MDERVLRYSIDLVVAALHMSPKAIRHGKGMQKISQDQK